MMLYRYLKPVKINKLIKNYNIWYNRIFAVNLPYDDISVTETFAYICNFMKELRSFDAVYEKNYKYLKYIAFED